MLSNILDRISFLSLFLVIILLPVFFLPFTNIPVEVSKGLLVVLGLTVSIIFWVIARFKDGNIFIPKSWILVSGLGVLLSVFLSGLFSSTISASFFGVMLDIGTVYFMLVAFLLMLFSSILFGNAKKAKNVFVGIAVFSVILFIFQALRLFIPNILSFSSLISKTDNILGSWNTFGLFAGFFTTMSLFMIEFFSSRKMSKFLLVILTCLSIAMTAVVNFSLVWAILGIFALVIFVYKVLFSFSLKQKEGEKRRFPLLSFVVVMLSLFFLMSGQSIGRILPDRLGLSSTEIRPTFQATMSIAGDVMMKDPVFGVGPNKFADVWGLYKPSSINSTNFWDTQFNVASGLLPTFFVTNGILGIIAWLIFFVVLVLTGLRSLFLSIRKNINWEASAFFIASVYLFVAAFFYSTGSVVLLLAFAFTGIFVGLSVSDTEEKKISISFLDDPRKSFFSIIFLVVLMIFSAAAAFKFVERLVSVSYFRKVLSASNIQTAEDAIEKAISLHKNDLYLRTYTQVYLTKIDTLVAKGSSLSEKDKADLQASFDKAVKSAEMAVEYDNDNYLNYSTLGLVYHTLGLLGVKDVYPKAIESFEKASSLNPLNPGIKLSIARVFFAEEKIGESRKYAKEALTLKPDYLEGLIISSQIEKSDGNANLALSYAEQALSLAPDNKELAQYVDSLR